MNRGIEGLAEVKGRRESRWRSRTEGDGRETRIQVLGKGGGGGRRGTTSVSLCIFWHKAELTSRRKWWRSSLVHGAFNGLILRPNFISFPPGSRKVFRRSSIIPLTLPALLSTGIRVINYQSASTPTTSSELQM